MCRLRKPAMGLCKVQEKMHQSGRSMWVTSCPCSFFFLLYLPTLSLIVRSTIEKGCLGVLRLDLDLDRTRKGFILWFYLVRLQFMGMHCYQSPHLYAPSASFPSMSETHGKIVTWTATGFGGCFPAGWDACIPMSTLIFAAYLSPTLVSYMLT